MDFKIFAKLYIQESEAMKLETVDYRAPDAAEQFVNSLRETGFGVLKNHPISQDLVESIYKNWYEFFTNGPKNDFHYTEST